MVIHSERNLEMVKCLHFETFSYTEREGSPFGIPVPEHYDFWIPLMKHFLAKSDTVVIHCWNEESITIEETKAISNDFEISFEGKLTYFKSKLNEEIIQSLLFENLTKYGELKWFSVFLSKGNKAQLNLGHWSTESTAENLSDQEVDFIKSIMPLDTNYETW